MRVWCRVMEDGEYRSVNIATAAIGFRALGATIEQYTRTDDMLGWVTRNDVVVDGVHQMKQVFRKFGIELPNSDYPEVLLPFAGRAIRTDTIGNLRRSNAESLFVKPTEEKRFAGKVIASPSDWASLVNISEDQQVYCSELVDIRSEYRVFLRHDKILDVRPYHGDYHYPADASLIDAAVEAFTEWQDRPAACALDFAVTDQRKTVFLEFNDAYAIGAYGLEPTVYSRFLTTRWTQLMNVPDHFALDSFTI